MPSSPTPIPAATVREPMTRLPGRVATLRSGIATTAPRSALWLGANFVLQVNSGPMRDEYRRFYYRDIQTLQMRRTPRGLVYNILLILLVVNSGLGGVVLGDPAAQASFFVFAVIFAGLLAANVFRGPTVHCLLRTAVGFYPLPSLSRRRPAQRAFARIRERVEAIQGTLSDEAVAARLDSALRGRQDIAAAAAPPPTAAAAFAPPVAAPAPAAVVPSV